jgi:hypothetical protein
VNAFLLFHTAVNADRVEHSLRQQFSKFLRAIDFIDEDDDLIDGKLVEQMAQLIELLVLKCLLGDTS